MIRGHQPGDMGGRGKGLYVEKASLVFLFVPLRWRVRTASALPGQEGLAGSLLTPLPVWPQKSQGAGGRRAKLESGGHLGESQTPQCCRLCCRHANAPSLLLSLLSSPHVTQHVPRGSWAEQEPAGREEAGSGSFREKPTQPGGSWKAGVHEGGICTHPEGSGGAWKRGTGVLGGCESRKLEKGGLGLAWGCSMLWAGGYH